MDSSNGTGDGNGNGSGKGNGNGLYTGTCAVLLSQGERSLIVRGGCCYPLEISTGPHPGINSDVQPILAAWAAQAQGESRIVDLRFPGRYGYAKEMAHMGVDYEISGDMLKIIGKGFASQLHHLA